MDDVRRALELAAEALSIAGDWGVGDVQIYPPEEWELVAYDEDESDGWCNIGSLATKLLEIRNNFVD